MFDMSKAAVTMVAACFLGRICWAEFPTNHRFDQWEGVASEARASRDILLTQRLHKLDVLPSSFTAAAFLADDPSSGGVNWRRVHAWVARKEHKRALEHLADVWVRATRTSHLKQSPAQQFEHWLATFWIGVADEALHSTTSELSGASSDTSAVLERAQQHMQQLVAASPARQAVLACIGLLAPHSDPSSQYAACKIAIGHTDALPKGLRKKNNPKKSSSKQKPSAKEVKSLTAFGNYSRGLVRIWRGHAILDAISAGVAIPGSQTSKVSRNEEDLFWWSRTNPDLCDDFEAALALGALDARQGLIECRYWLTSFERRANVFKVSSRRISNNSSNTQASEDGSSTKSDSSEKALLAPAQVRAVRRLEYDPGPNLAVTLDAAWRRAAARGEPLVLTGSIAQGNSGDSSIDIDADDNAAEYSTSQMAKEAATLAWLNAACSGAVADDFGLYGRGDTGSADGGFSQTSSHTFGASADPNAPPPPPITLGAVLGALGSSPRSDNNNEGSVDTRPPPRSSSPVSQVQWARWQASSACPRLLPSLQVSNSSTDDARHLRAPEGSPLDATHAWRIPPVAAFAFRVGGICWPAAATEGTTSASLDDVAANTGDGNSHAPISNGTEASSSFGGCAPVSPIGALSIAASRLKPESSDQAASMRSTDRLHFSAPALDYANIDNSDVSAWQLWVNNINDKDYASGTKAPSSSSSPGNTRLHVDALASHHAVTMLSGTKVEKGLPTVLGGESV